jgi:hypothetical protein
MSNTKKIIHELKHHTPLTIIASVTAIIVTFLCLYLLKSIITEDTFHSLHLIHLFASAFVSAAIFYKYKNNIFSSTIVGVISAILIGSISDIIFPWLGGQVLFLKTTFHLPLLEIPLLILGISILGSLAGIWLKKTKFPHFLHVFLSAFASLFYILTFSPQLNAIFIILSIIIIFIAVIIPCCVSDIIMPFLFLKQDIKQCNCH